MAINEAQTAIVGCRLAVLDEPRIRQDQEGKFQFSDLPVQPLGRDPKTQNFVQVIEVIFDDITMNCIQSLYSAMRERRELPTDFQLRNPLPPRKLQAISTNIGGRPALIRHFILEQRTSLTMLRSALRGDIYILDCSKIPSRRHISFYLQYIMEGLPGHGCYIRELVPLQKGPLRTAAEIDMVFDFIRDHGPLGSADNQNLRWIEKQRNDPESPLFQYPQSVLKEALHNLSSGKALAGAVSGYPITLKDAHNWVLEDIVQPLLKSASQFSAILLGPAGLGKTPLANAICTALSQYWQQELGVANAVPKFKSGNNLDFFRSEPGTIFVPAVLDDGNLAAETIMALKAFLDVSGSSYLWSRA